MRYIEQSDFTKALLAAAGIASAQDIELAAGLLIVDGQPYQLAAHPLQPVKAAPAAEVPPEEVPPEEVPPEEVPPEEVPPPN